jgi:hypothetical protein
LATTASFHIFSTHHLQSFCHFTFASIKLV